MSAALPVYPIIFNFSESHFTKDTEKTYTNFLRSVFSNLFIDELELQQDYYDSIKCSSDDFTKWNPEKLAYLLSEVLCKHHLVTNINNQEGEDFIKNHKLTSKGTMFIDLVNVDIPLVDPRNMKSLLYYVTNIITNDDRILNSRNPNAILVVNKLDSILDDIRNENLTKLLEKDKIIVTDYKGNTTLSRSGSFKSKLNGWKKSFENEGGRIFANHEEKFRRKLVGHIGHFSRPPRSKSRCHYYFYSLDYAMSELKYILEPLMQSESYGFIVTDFPETEGLDSTINSVMSLIDTERGTNTPIYDFDKNLNIETLSTDRQSDFKKHSTSCKGLILLDVVHQGDRVNYINSYLRQLNSHINFDIVSILYTVSNPNIESIENSVHGISFKALFKVKQKFAAYPCKYCSELDLPFTDLSKDKNFLSSFHFWVMCDHNYFISEKNPPSHRNSIKSVPDFEKIIKENSAFLSLKIQQLLSSKLGKTEYQLRYFTFIGPYEQGTIEISKCLGHFLGVNCILIPKNDVANIVRNSTKAIADIEVSYKDEWWYKAHLQNTSKGTSNEVIVFDEFCTDSTSTLSDYGKLSALLGYSVKAYMPLVKFNGLTAFPNSSTPIFSLYEIPLILSHYKFNTVLTNANDKRSEEVGNSIARDTSKKP